MLHSTKCYQQFGTLKPFAQSFENSIPPIGYVCSVTQEKIKQEIYKCTKSTSKYKAITSECLLFLCKQVTFNLFSKNLQRLFWPGKRLFSQCLIDKEIWIISKNYEGECSSSSAEVSLGKPNNGNGRKAKVESAVLSTILLLCPGMGQVRVLNCYSKR